MVDKRHSDRQTYTRKAGALLAGLFLLTGACLATTARSDESRIPGTVLQSGGSPFVDTVQLMVLRDQQIRRDIMAGLRPASDPVVGVSRYSNRSKGTQVDGAVYLPTPLAGNGGVRSTPGARQNPQALGPNFVGITQQDQIDAFGGSGAFPPDTMGAIGPNHFVEVLRGSVGIYDRTGARLSLVTLNSFFTTGSYPRGDCYSPQVLYDRRSGRWFACALETNGGANNHIILAVSATNNPTGTWSKFAIQVGEAATRTDEVKLGTDDNGVYFGALMVPSGAVFGKVAATRKASLIAASPSLSTVYQWRNITDMFATPVPTHNQDAVAAQGYQYILSSSATVYANLEYRTLQWAVSGLPTLSLTAEVTTNAYGSVVDAPANGSATPIDTRDDRVLMAVQRASTLWTCRTVGVTSTGGAGAVDRTAAEWLALNVAGAGPVLSQQGRVFDGAATDPRFYYYPSISVSGQGHAAMGFSGSKAAEYVGAYTCGRLATDAAGTMQAVTQITPGLASYERLVSGQNRWGNTSYTSIDPNDDMSLWTVQEFADSTAANPTNVWGTWIAKLLAPAPLITSAAGSVVQGVTGKTLVITGSRFFDPGAGYANRINVTLSGDGISNYVVTYNSPTQVTVQFDVSLDATIGMRDVTVTNPDGQSVTAAGVFEIIRAIPTTVTVDDVTGVVGETVVLSATLTDNDTSAGIPGKTISFKIDGTNVGTGTTDASGVATRNFTIPEGAVGAHTITASFAFDGTYRPSEGTGTGTVNKADTTLVADDKTAKIGATVGLTATLTRTHDAALLANKAIDFKVDGTGVGSANTSASGVATLNYVVPEAAGVGDRVITADFAGNADYNPSTDGATLTVEKGDTALAVPNVTGTIGASVDLTATLTVVGAGLPLEGKSVDIKVDGTVVGTDATDASGVATVSYAVPGGMAVGDHDIDAEFAGDANYNDTSGSGTLHVNVNTTIAVAPVAGMIGVSVTLQGTLTRADTAAPVAGKNLNFSVDGTAVGTASTNGSGVATQAYVIPEAAGAGDRTITVAFAGDLDYNASTADGVLTVQQTTTKMAATDRSGAIGANVELRAYVYRTTDNGPVVGRTVTFKIDGTVVGTGVTAADGRATYTWKVDEGAGAGARTITAEFAGDATYSGSTANGTLTVSKANTTVSGLNRTGVNGGSVELKGYLRRTTDLAWVVGRTLDFSVDGTAVGSGVTDAAGMAFTPYTITNEPGQYPIGIDFAGDAAYNAGSGGATLTVTGDTALAVADTAGQIGATVDLSATLTRTFDGDPVAGKSVAFKVDGTNVGSGNTDAAGVATTGYLIAVGSGVGARTIAADFAGDVVYGASSGTGTLTVNPADTTTTAADAAGKIHASVDLSATVTRNTDSGPVVGGTVDFEVDGTGVGSAATNGSGTATTSYAIPEGAGAGARAITAKFAGDAESNASQGNGTLTVSKADSALTVNSPTGTAGASVDITGTLTTNPPIPGRTVDVKVDGTVVGSPVTDGSGNYTLNYAIPADAAVGAHTIDVEFAGDGSYNPSSASGTLTVKSNTTTAVYAAAGKPGAVAELAAQLTANNNGNVLAGKSIAFSVDGTAVGSANTDAAGVARINYTVPDGAVSKTITADFAGDADYNASTGNGNLAVEPADTTLYTVNRTGTITEQVILRQYDLKRTTDNAMLSGKTITFSVDGTPVGTGTTDAGGDAALVWTIAAGPASRTITVAFAGDANYNASSANATLTCQTWATKMIGFNRTARITDRTELRARLLRLDNTPVIGKSVNFYVDGTFIISRTTTTTGDARFPNYDVPDGAGAGDRVIRSEWLGDGGYDPSTVDATLTVNKAISYIWVLAKTVPVGSKTSLYSLFRRLYDYQKQATKPVTWKIDGTVINTLNTDANGVTSFVYQTTEAVGDHTMRVEFAGDAWLDAGFGEATLRIY